MVGIVTGVGGQTSHSAIMARSLEIPAVVGVEDILAHVQSGDTVVVDAIDGRILVRPTAAGRSTFERVTPRVQAFHEHQWDALSAAETRQLHLLLAKALWPDGMPT